MEAIVIIVVIILGGIIGTFGDREEPGPYFAGLLIVIFASLTGGVRIGETMMKERMKEKQKEVLKECMTDSDSCEYRIEFKYKKLDSGDYEVSDTIVVNKNK